MSLRRSRDLHLSQRSGLRRPRSLPEVRGRPDRRDLDLALLPGESVNDDGLFIDGLRAELLAAELPVEIRFSQDFADALEAGAAA